MGKALSKDFLSTLIFLVPCAFCDSEDEPAWNGLAKQSPPTHRPARRGAADNAALSILRMPASRPHWDHCQSMCENTGQSARLCPIFPPLWNLSEEHNVKAT